LALRDGGAEAARIGSVGAGDASSRPALARTGPSTGADGGGWGVAAGASGTGAPAPSVGPSTIRAPRAGADASLRRRPASSDAPSPLSSSAQARAISGSITYRMVDPGARLGPNCGVLGGASGGGAGGGAGAGASAGAAAGTERGAG
jgi:hypothetical protein